MEHKKKPKKLGETAQPNPKNLPLQIWKHIFQMGTLKDAIKMVRTHKWVQQNEGEPFNVQQQMAAVLSRFASLNISEVSQASMLEYIQYNKPNLFVRELIFDELESSNLNVWNLVEANFSKLAILTIHLYGQFVQLGSPIRVPDTLKQLYVDRGWRAHNVDFKFDNVTSLETLEWCVETFLSNEEVVTALPNLPQLKQLKLRAMWLFHEQLSVLITLSNFCPKLQVLHLNWESGNPNAPHMNWFTQAELEQLFSKCRNLVDVLLQIREGDSYRWTRSEEKPDTWKLGRETSGGFHPNSPAQQVGAVVWSGIRKWSIIQFAVAKYVHTFDAVLQSFLLIEKLGDYSIDCIELVYPHLEVRNKHFGNFQLLLQIGKYCREVRLSPASYYGNQIVMKEGKFQVLNKGPNFYHFYSKELVVFLEQHFQRFEQVEDVKMVVDSQPSSGSTRDQHFELSVEEKKALDPDSNMTDEQRMDIWGQHLAKVTQQQALQRWNAEFHNGQAAVNLIQAIEDQVDFAIPGLLTIQPQTKKVEFLVPISPDLQKEFTSTFF